MRRPHFSNFLFALMAIFFLVAAANAQDARVATPSFWDPGLQRERPDLSGLRAIRFLTDDDYPPLNFALADGSLAGFNVEIARAVCEELQVGCTIQARRWDTIVDSLLEGKGDAIIASIAATPATRGKIDFTQPYYRTPARFVVRKDSPLRDATPATLAGKTIGVIAGSAHRAFLDGFFPGIIQKTYPDAAALYEALRKGSIDALFGDGLSLAIWLNGAASDDCCAFKGGAYTESRFFGEGVGIALRKEDTTLRRALDWALARLAARGIYAELYLKYFPVGFY
ncbi:transporter substrate-binding domain-containing protein [Methylocapsa sp. S129]|uniref:transporter substrate-binding domain-containing protein n=1 Tax=Methylocapsa sp. S129 TaxID=1641869 RepID=UPI001FEF3CE1|nr:transporter substrate-binding domain-containing protein [Methylocapsa sp. S129]